MRVDRAPVGHPFRPPASVARRAARDAQSRRWRPISWRSPATSRSAPAGGSSPRRAGSSTRMPCRASCFRATTMCRSTTCSRGS